LLCHQLANISNYSRTSAYHYQHTLKLTAKQRNESLEGQIRMKRLGLIVATALLMLGLASATFDPSQAPTGTHVQTGTPGCIVDSSGTVTCNTFELAGVGNTNADATLTATYSATVDCRNNGGKVVAVKTGTFTTQSTTGSLSPKNGRLTVPTLQVKAPTEDKFLALQTCPNPNWTPEIQAGTTITLASFMYTLHFVGFTGDYITIEG
jgi:hypothetical protein